MKVSTVGGRFDPWAFFDYRKTVYPDVYDPNEALLCSRYKVRQRQPCRAAAGASGQHTGMGVWP